MVACIWMVTSPSWIFRPGAQQSGRWLAPEHKFLQDWRTPACPQVGICSSAHPTSFLPIKLVSTAPGCQRPGVCGLEEENSGSGEGWVLGEWLQPKAALFSYPVLPQPQPLRSGRRPGSSCTWLRNHQQKLPEESQSLVLSTSCRWMVCCVYSFDFLPWGIIKPWVIKGFLWWPIVN